MSVIHNVLLALSLSLHLFASSVSSHFADSDAEEVLAAKLQKRLTKRLEVGGRLNLVSIWFGWFL